MFVDSIHWIQCRAIGYAEQATRHDTRWPRIPMRADSSFFPLLERLPGRVVTSAAASSSATRASTHRRVGALCRGQRRGEEGGAHVVW